MPTSPPQTSASSPVSSRLLRLLGWLVILAGALVILRSLPLPQVMELVQKKVTTFGPWGPLVFGVAYILAGLLFVPGSALTLAAGALFGLVWGTITVSLASTTVAGLAFLIARYAARAKVQGMAGTNRTFAAIDRAIAEGGWRIIAMLRLSPAVPFSLGNYLYGLTAVKFWPYLIASWVCMAPGTFLYVYIGFATAQAAGAGGSGGGGKNPWEWVLMGVGLLATVAVTVYVTRLARRALKDGALNTEDSGGSDQPANAAPSAPKSSASLLIVAGCVAGLGVFAAMNKARLSSLLGPPKVTPVEAYEPKEGGPVFDHSRFDAILQRHVSPGGWVDYEGLKRDAGELDGYIQSLARAKPDDLGRDERLALLINAYNAFTLRLILDHLPIVSIKDIPAEERWDAKRWNIAGEVSSLNQIEHEQIRPNFKEPRVHFALVCAAVGCPPLRGEVYTGAKLEEQLADQTLYIHSHPRWLRVHADTNEVELTSLYDWYGSDFTAQGTPTVLDFAVRYAPEVDAMTRSGAAPKVKFLEYSWALNSVSNRQEENR